MQVVEDGQQGLDHTLAGVLDDVKTFLAGPLADVVHVRRQAQARETRRQILEAALPGVFICASAEIVPEMFRATL